MFKDAFVVETALKGAKTLAELQGSLKSLMSIHNNRFYKLFDVLLNHPTFVEALIQQYTQLETGESAIKTVHRDVKALLSLAIAGYQMRIQDFTAGATSETNEAANESAYKAEALSQNFSLLQPLLDSKVETIQKVTISVLLANLSKYSETMARILSLKKLPTFSQEGKKREVLIIDFAPHLLRYIFSLLRVSKEPKGVTYQLAFKVAKKFEQSILSLYGGKFMEHLA